MRLSGRVPLDFSGQIWPLCLASSEIQKIIHFPGAPEYCLRYGLPAVSISSTRLPYEVIKWKYHTHDRPIDHKDEFSANPSDSTGSVDAVTSRKGERAEGLPTHRHSDY